MYELIKQIAGQAKKTIKNWWLVLVVGVLCIAAGITVFCYPVDSYFTLSIFLGVFMLISGISELVVALTSRNWFMTRGYNVTGAILDILVGLLLCARPSITALALPIILGVWLLYHGFMIIGIAGDFKSFGMKKTGWITAGGILLLILSILIIVNPLTFGTSAIIVILGVALICTGAAAIGFSFRLKNIRNYVKEFEDAKIEY